MSGLRFRTLAWLTIGAVYFLILVGGVVRASGSGMGCPDWPKCFDRWIPPTSESQLPPDYQQVYADHGYGAARFNALKTWTEYINRLVGVVIGFLIFLMMVASFRYWSRDRAIVGWSVVALVLVAFQGWLGSVVVESNLAPWMVTVHMMVALLLVGLLIYTLTRAEPEGAQPRSHLARLRAEAEANGDDDDALLTAGLLRLLEHMNQQASIFNLPRQSQTLSFAEGARMMSREYGKVAELAPALKPILSESADEFVRLALDSSAAAAALAVAADEEDATSGRAAQGRVMQNCASCHDLALTGLDGPLKKATAEARSIRGVGNGFYQIGHDMRIRHPDRERAQLVADALRRGALLLDSLSSGQ